MTVISQCRQRSAYFAAAIAALLGLATTPATFAIDDFRISTLSTKPELVSGGDVLVRIDVPRKLSLQSVRVELNGRNISGAFRADAGERTLTGLVSGLRLGTNVLEASVRSKGHGRSERLTLTNHPISGPIFSGSHQNPFICETEVFGLGPALDEDCSAPTKVEYLYFTTANAFRTYNPAGPRPVDLARTTTIEGNTVDFIVRVETGTINRAVYQIAFLHQPGTPLPNAWTKTPGWNGRLIYTFGGGLRASYHQGRWITGGSSGVPGRQVHGWNRVGQLWRNCSNCARASPRVVLLLRTARKSLRSRIASATRLSAINSHARANAACARGPRRCCFSGLASSTKGSRFSSLRWSAGSVAPYSLSRRASWRVTQCMTWNQHSCRWACGQTAAKASG